MRFVVLVGRVFYVAIFLESFSGHFFRKTIVYAASHGVPLPLLLVPASGVIALLGALLISYFGSGPLSVDALLKARAK